jgi:hypothetical protein
MAEGPSQTRALGVTSRIAILLALALVPVIPYLLLGYTGQDLLFHVSSWLDLRDGWLSGRLNPGWSDAAKYGRGDPHLTIYPPVSYFLGALLTLILPLRIAPAAFAWIALVISGLSMYAASKAFVAERDRLPAAILYMLGPYTVTVSLIRFAAAELLVQAWLPLIALFFYKAVWNPAAERPRSRPASRRPIVLLGLLLGLSWLTNIPASIVLLYSLGAAAVVGAILRRSVLPLLRLALAEAIALALAAFHLLPVWSERNWIHTDALLRIDTLQLLLLMPHSNFTDGPILVACWIFLCVQVALVIACLRRRALPLSADPAVPLWAALAAAAFVLQSPLAIPLWLHAPELRFVQFPLRFLAILGVTIPLLLFSRGTRLSLRRPAYVLTALLTLLPFLGYLSEQAVPVNRSPPLADLVASWRSRGAPEYLPAGTILPAGPSNLPAASVVDPANPATPIANSNCHVQAESQRPALRIFHTTSPVPCRIRLNVYFYPLWHATSESGQSLPLVRDSTGLILVDLPPGSHTVTLVFRTASPLRTASALVSLAALLLAAISLTGWPGSRRATETKIPPEFP